MTNTPTRNQHLTEEEEQKRQSLSDQRDILERQSTRIEAEFRELGQTIILRAMRNGSWWVDGDQLRANDEEGEERLGRVLMDLLGLGWHSSFMVVVGGLCLDLYLDDGSVRISFCASSRTINQDMAALKLEDVDIDITRWLIETYDRELDRERGDAARSTLRADRLEEKLKALREKLGVCVSDACDEP